MKCLICGEQVREDYQTNDTGYWFALLTNPQTGRINWQGAIHITCAMRRAIGWLDEDARSMRERQQR